MTNSDCLTRSHFDFNWSRIQKIGEFNCSYVLKKILATCVQAIANRKNDNILLSACCVILLSLHNYLLPLTPCRQMTQSL